MKNKEREEKIVAKYNELLSFTLVGKMFGISKQRVHQIVTHYGNTGKKGREYIYERAWKGVCEMCKEASDILHHKDFDNNNESSDNLTPLCTKCHYKVHKMHRRELCGNVCKNCGRVLGTDISQIMVKKSLCYTCDSIQKGETSGKNLFYPKICSVCNVQLQKKNRSNYMCLKCYHNFLYKTDEKRRLRQSNWYKNKRMNDPEYREKRNAICRAYYHSHK